MNLIMITFQSCLLLKSYVKQPAIIGLIDDNIYEIIIALFGSTFFFCLLTTASTGIEYVCKKDKPDQSMDNIKTFKSFKSWK